MQTSHAWAQILNCCCVHVVELPSQSAWDSDASTVFLTVPQAKEQGQGEGVARWFHLRTSGGCVLSHSSGSSLGLSTVLICFEIPSSLKDANPICYSSSQVS